MNRLVQVAVALLALLIFPCAQTHEVRNHMPVSMKKAVEIALATTRDYTLEEPPFGFQQLDQSWRNLVDSNTRIYENGRGYYVVSVEHPAQKRTLYLRVLLDGRVDAANFSGNFVLSTATSSAR